MFLPTGVTDYSMFILTEVTEVFTSVLHNVNGPDELENVHGETEVLRL